MASAITNPIGTLINIIIENSSRDFANVIKTSDNIWETLINLPKNVFAPFLEPLSNLFNGTTNIFDLLGDIPGMIGDVFSALLQGLFIPENDYFSNKFNEVKLALINNLGYDEYINIFSDLENVNEGNINSINLENYKIGSLTINISNFKDISKISNYRDTWFSWVRGFIFVLLIIYNFNQIYKLIRGTSLADGVSTISHMSGGANK